MIPTDVLHFEPEAFITLDFETYYANDYTLTKMTPESYIRDERFEVIGVGVKVNDAETLWYEEAEFRAWASTVDWSRCSVLAHNGSGFDFGILAFIYDIHAGFYFDTEDMARALYGPHGVVTKLKLAALSAYHGVGEKGDEVEKARGKRRADFTQEEWEQYGLYCIQDTELCKKNFDIMLSMLPEVELWHIDTHVRMWTEPQFVLDEKFLGEYLVWERQRKAELLARVAQDKSVLMSNDKFANLLIDFGVVPPRKISAKKTKTARLKDPEADPVETWAFAKNDPGMQELLEHETEEIRWLAEARVAIKSTINETRSERMLKLGKNGRKLAVQLRYAAAHTFRSGGAGKMNFQNLERVNKRKPTKGAIRKSLEAPVGEKVVVADSAAIEARGVAWFAGQDDLVELFAENRDPYNEFGSELYGRVLDRKHVEADVVPGLVAKTCLGPDTLVLTERGWVRIVEVQREDRVWDGVEWVNHAGVVYQGERETWALHSVAATPDHKVLTEMGWVPWSMALTSPSLFRSALSLAKLPLSVGSERLTATAFRWGGIRHSDVVAESSGRLREPECLRARVCVVAYARTVPENGTHTPENAEGLENDSLTPPELCLVNLPCSSGARSLRKRPENFTAGRPRSDVRVDGQEWLSERTSLKVLLVAVPPVGAKRRTLRALQISEPYFLMMPTESDCLTVFQRALLGAIAPPAKSGSTMVVEVSSFARNGALVGSRSCGTPSRLLGGITRRWTWTALTTRRDMNRGTSGLSLEASMRRTNEKSVRCKSVSSRSTGESKSLKQRMHVYDLANSGPRQQFTVLTDAGPVIVHNCVLGLGYSMGAFKFAQTLLAGPMGADPIRFTRDDAETMGVNPELFSENDSKMERLRAMPSRLSEADLVVHCAVAEHVVRTYREKNNRIKALWKEMEDVIEWMEVGEEVTFGPNNCVQTVRHGLLLPNGVTMRYFGLKRSEDGDYSYIGGHGKEHVHLYGGLLTENIIQALARIVVFDQALMLRGKYGYKPALMTHDEIVLVVPEKEAEVAKSRMLEEMRVAPPWAKGLPLNAEAGFAQRYGLAKS